MTFSDCLDVCLMESSSATSSHQSSQPGASSAPNSETSAKTVIDENFSAIEFLKEFSKFPEQEYEMDFADKLFRRLVISQDFTRLKDQEFLFVLSGLHTFIERVICSKERMISLEDACFKLIMSYKYFTGKTFFTDKTMQNIFTGFVMYLTCLSSERLCDVFEEPFLRPHIMIPAISDLLKRQKCGKDLRFFTNPKLMTRVNKKKIDKCIVEVVKYLEKNFNLIEKYMERHKDADLLFQMQIITLFKRLLTYEPDKVASWLVDFCPKFVKNLGQDIDYNILVARAVTKLINVAHAKPELIQMICNGCSELFRLIIRKFTWKSKYTFVSYDDKQNHEIEINPELFCVFVSCSYSCCNLPACGDEYLALVNTRLEKLNNEALMKMLTDNDACLVEFLLRNLTFVATKTFKPTVGRLLPIHPNEAHKEFLISTSWSTQLMIDFLIGDETRFLEYFIKFLKYHEQNCNLVELTNQSCCFASHFEELQQKLRRMSEKKLIPYNIDPLLNRLTKVLTVCSKQEGSPVLTLHNDWLDSQADVTAVNLKADKSMSQVLLGGDTWIPNEDQPGTSSGMKINDTITTMNTATQLLTDYSDAVSGYGSVSSQDPASRTATYQKGLERKTSNDALETSKSLCLLQSDSQNPEPSLVESGTCQSAYSTLPFSELSDQH